MQTGALAFVDCLGFKGIWKRGDPEAVLNSLNSAERRARLYIKIMGWIPEVEMRCVSLSDTVVVGVTLPSRTAVNEGVKGSLVTCAAVVAKEVAGELIKGNPPIAVRGCITFGEFILRDSHIIGPAVDEAAELHERANGAFVWAPTDLAPQIDAGAAVARRAMEQCIAEQLLRIMQSHYPETMAATPQA